LFSKSKYRVVVIGGGVVGTAAAMAIQKTSDDVLVLEAENKLAAHQTGNNSGVIHSGLYYKPGSLKARNCVEGRTRLEAFCDERGVKYERCGKIVLATDESQLPALEELQRRGEANGLKGVRRLRAEEISDYEPSVKGVAALHVAETGIIDYTDVVEEYAKVVRENGGETVTGVKFLSAKRDGNELVLLTTAGEIRADYLVNCAGLQSDRVARACGVVPSVAIVPFRGEYYELREEKEHLVKNLIYPVPDPRFPFLGVHFTRMIKGGVEAGPNAVLAFKREGYKFANFSPRDVAGMFFYGGFWRMAATHWRMGFGEMRRSISKKTFVRSLQELIPEVTGDDVFRAGAGVRAQALERNGKLTDDFRIVEAERMVHALNAPSPAATASISIGEEIADVLAKQRA
jgi:L-2-hydroxyglutarate oxidase